MKNFVIYILYVYIMPICRSVYGNSILLVLSLFLIYIIILFIAYVFLVYFNIYFPVDTNIKHDQFINIDSNIKSINNTSIDKQSNLNESEVIHSNTQLNNDIASNKNISSSNLNNNNNNINIYTSTGINNFINSFFQLEAYIEYKNELMGYHGSYRFYWAIARTMMYCTLTISFYWYISIYFNSTTTIIDDILKVQLSKVSDYYFFTNQYYLSITSRSPWYPNLNGLGLDILFNDMMMDLSSFKIKLEFNNFQELIKKYNLYRINNQLLFSNTYSGWITYLQGLKFYILNVEFNTIKIK